MNKQEQLDQAKTLNNSGQYTQAISLLYEIQAQCETDPKWHYRLAFALTYTNQFQKAIQQLETSLSRYPQYPHTYLLLGMLYYWQGHYIKSYTTVEQGLQVYRATCTLNTPFSEEGAEEFESTLYCIFVGMPFVNHENWQNSVLSNEFLDYDPHADEAFKIYTESPQDLKHFLQKTTQPLKQFRLSIPQPLHHHPQDLYEKDIDFKLIRKHIGFITETKQWSSPHEPILYTEIDFKIYQEETQNTLQGLIQILHQHLMLPKGTLLKSQPEGEALNLGVYETIGLIFNEEQAHLEQEYHNPPLTKLIQLIILELDKQQNQKQRFIGKIYTYNIVPDEKTWVYFIGPSYKEMQKIISQVLQRHPEFEYIELIDSTQRKHPCDLVSIMFN